MACARSIGTLTLLIGLALLLIAVRNAAAIRCYSCGAYIASDDFRKPNAKISACTHFNPNSTEFVKDCGPLDTACMKFEVQGNMVLRCAANCQEDFDEVNDRSISCCTRDLCNTAISLTTFNYLFASVLVALLLGVLLV